MIFPLDTISAAPPDAARALLGAELHVGEGPSAISSVITEVEAYGGPAESPWPDPGAHTWPGLTPRNRVMFGPPGHLYVYRSYGIHHCANITCGADGIGGGVLIRSVRITTGLTTSLSNRGHTQQSTRLSAGPGNVAQALGITMDDYGLNLLSQSSRVRLCPADHDDVIVAGPRVGLRAASSREWRFHLAGETVFAYRAHRKADGLT